MALPSYLSNIKSSGIYRFVWDKSEIPNIESNLPMRLVVGYSEKGPFNIPVYIETQTNFRKVFGGVSKKLERYGCFFHRLALQALRQGPILCLNLKNFDTETINAVSFDLGDSLKDVLGSTEIANIFNTSRFWTLEPEILEDSIQLAPGVNTAEKYITITATDSKESSNTIFVRGYEPDGYDVTFKEWYSAVLNGAEVPSYLEGFENNKLNRYWAEVYVFRGEFTKEIATSDVLAKYFDVNGSEVKLKPYITNAFGEKKDTLDLLAANEASNFIRKYQGILLPEFVGANGSPISLDIVFNSDNELHKMMMRLNQTLLYNEDGYLDKIDATGWTEIMDKSTVHPGDVRLVTTDEESSLSIDGITPVIYGYNWNDGSWDAYMASAENNEGTIEPKMDLDGMSADFYMYNLDTASAQISREEDYVAKITVSGNESESTGTESENSDENPPTATANDIRNSAKSLAQMAISVGDTWVMEDGDKYKTLNITKVESLQTTYEYEATDEEGTAEWGTGVAQISDTQDKLNQGYTKVKVIPDESSSIGNEAYIESNAVVDGSTKNELYHEVNGQIVPFDTSVFVKIKLVGPGSMNITFDQKLPDTMNNYFIKCVGSVLATSINLVPTYVQGYTYQHAKPSSSSQEAKNGWIDYQLSILDTKGIREALINRTAVDFRYLVDTFESFAVNGECKAKLALICKLKDNAFGLLNFPAMKSFDKSSICFKGSDGILDTKYIAEGCNPMYANGQEFKLASQDNGASWVSYNTPVIISDPETGVKTTIPSAALVSNDFMDKYTKFLPYSIVAGVKKGMITDPNLIGPDFSFGRYDLDNLEPMGVNAMVYVPGKGTYINSNQTAKQNPVTALSKIHIRELCIFLQDEIEKMMENYHWDFNTPNLRQTLKDRADVICETCKNNQGIYAYFNQCDTQNNTPEIIDNECIILATSIEPSRGAGKMIQELTLYRTGGLSIAIKDA